MPIYEFINNETGEQFEQIMSIADKEQYLQDNPSISQLLDAPMISMESQRFMGVKPIDQGWKDTLRKIHKRAPGSQLNNISSVGF